METKSGRDWVAIILAAGLVMVMVLVVAAVLYAAVTNSTPLGDNAAQVLNVGIAALAGLLGAYLGAQFSKKPDDEPKETST